MKNLAFAITAVVLAMAIPAMAADDKVSLTPRFLPGTYVYNTSTAGESSVSTADREMPGGKTGTEMTMEMTVSQPDAKGNKEMAIQFTKFKQALSLPGRAETSYSSTQPSDESKDPWASIFKSLRAAKITATIAPDGSISDIKGVEEAFANTPGDAASSAVKNQMKSFFSENALKGTFYGARNLLPKEPVAVGQTYKYTATMALPTVGAVDVTYEGKVVSIDKTNNGPVATIDYNAAFDKDSMAAEPGASTKPVMNNLKHLVVTRKGQVRFNTDLGAATQWNDTQVTDTEMGTATATMKIKQTSTMTTDVTFTPAK